jgi:hypothetical protein
MDWRCSYIPGLVHLLLETLLFYDTGTSFHEKMTRPIVKQQTPKKQFGLSSILLPDHIFTGIVFSLRLKIHGI